MTVFGDRAELRTFTGDPAPVAEQAIRDAVRDFAQAEIRPRSQQFEAAGGYPDGLSGEAIPLPARIVALVDVFDALTTPRPYKEAWTLAAAFDYVKSQSGLQFDPAVVDAVLARRERIEEIHRYFAPAQAAA